MKLAVYGIKAAARRPGGSAGLCRWRPGALPARRGAVIRRASQSCAWARRDRPLHRTLPRRTMSAHAHAWMHRQYLTAMSPHSNCSCCRRRHSGRGSITLTTTGCARARGDGGLHQHSRGGMPTPLPSRHLALPAGMGEPEGRCAVLTIEVAAGVALVQLKAVHRIPPRVQQRHPERPQPAVLRVPLGPSETGSHHAQAPLQDRCVREGRWQQKQRQRRQRQQHQQQRQRRRWWHSRNAAFSELEPACCVRRLFGAAARQ